MKNFIKKYCISESATLLDALIKIQSNGHKTVLVVKNDLTLSGILSDGDIRRALIREVLIQEPVSSIANKNFLFLGNKKRKIKLNESIYILPVVKKGKLIDVIECK